MFRRRYWKTGERNKTGGEGGNGRNKLADGGRKIVSWQVKLEESSKRFYFQAPMYVLDQKLFELKISRADFDHDLGQYLRPMLLKRVRSHLNDLLFHGLALARNLKLVSGMLRALARGRMVKRRG